LFVSATYGEDTIRVEPSGFTDLCLSRIAAIIFVVLHPVRNLRSAVNAALAFCQLPNSFTTWISSGGLASMLSDDETAVAFRVSGFIKSLSTSRRLETELFAASQVLAVPRVTSIRLQTLLLENSFV
jgi:hypothetical protein